MKKRGEFNFVWLFAIIAGTAVLLLAIMGAVRYGKTITITQDTEIAKTLSVVTDSMQAGFASARKSTIRFDKETKIDNQCFEGNAPENFGYSELSVLTKERPNSEFEIGGIPIKVKNKYLFISNQPGKEFYVFSVPLTFAFRIADLIIIDSQSYCFVGLEEQEEIVNSLRIIGNNAKFDIANCTEESIKVCFDGRGNNCDIIVYPECNNPRLCENEYEIGRVERDGFTLPYAGNLIYPAIFSERESYLCNVKRLLYRQSILSNLYAEKIEFMASRNCNSDLVNELESFETTSFEMSRNFIEGDLFEIYFEGKLIGENEEDSQCKLWS